MVQIETFWICRWDEHL